jgi:hypothetical protein
VWVRKRAATAGYDSGKVADLQSRRLRSTAPEPRA